MHVSKYVEQEYIFIFFILYSSSSTYYMHYNRFVTRLVSGCATLGGCLGAIKCTETYGTWGFKWLLKYK